MKGGYFSVFSTTSEMVSGALGLWGMRRRSDWGYRETMVASLRGISGLGRLAEVRWGAPGHSALKGEGRVWPRRRLERPRRGVMAGVAGRQVGVGVMAGVAGRQVGVGMMADVADRQVGRLDAGVLDVWRRSFYVRPLFADPKNHVGFKKSFGHEEHKPLLLALLHDLLELDVAHRIVQVELLEPEQRPNVPELKRSIVDVKCMDAHGTRYVVEMQVLNVEGFEKRVVCNVAKAYVGQLEVGDHYPDLDDVSA